MGLTRGEDSPEGSRSPVARGTALCRGPTLRLRIDRKALLVANEP